MKSATIISPAAQIAVAAIVLLGLLGGCLIVAYSGFNTSPRLGGPSTFVPAPEAYLLAALLYAMSSIGLLVLLQSRKASGFVILLAAVLYIAAAVLLAAILAG